MSDKEKLLTERGWYQWYNPDYWCHAKMAVEGIDETHRGLSTDEAYAFETDEKERKKILIGMGIHFGVLKAISEMARR